jgi:regulator of replication initiation timing
VSVDGWASLAGAVGFVPGLQWLWRRVARNPKQEAEARKLNAEADDLLAVRLWAEIERLDRDLKEVRSELETVKAAAADEKTALETENKRLRLEVSFLRKRVEQLEEIIKTKTTPADMLAQLAEIDRRTVARDEP